MGREDPWPTNPFVEVRSARVSLETLDPEGPDFLTTSGTLMAQVSNTAPGPADLGLGVLISLAAFASPVPEPATLWLLLTGLAGLFAWRARPPRTRPAG